MTRQEELLAIENAIKSGKLIIITQEMKTQHDLAREEKAFEAQSSRIKKRHGNLSNPSSRNKKLKELIKLENQS